MTSPIINMKKLKKIFYSDDVETHALSNINLRIYEGEYISISGPSGCGKSTLLSVIGLLDTASEGEYELAGHQVETLNSKERTQARNKEIGFIFQSFNLISDMTVLENVELPLSYRKDLNPAQRKEAAKNALEKVELYHRVNHYPAQLSGGQQQRVAVARAIAGSPTLLLADEPTGNLDSKNAENVMQLLDNLHSEGATICMVTHDPKSAERAQRIIRMMDGQIISDESTENNTHSSKINTSTKENDFNKPIVA